MARLTGYVLETNAIISNNKKWKRPTMVGTSIIAQCHVAAGPEERNYSAWVSWKKVKVYTGQSSLGSLYFPFPHGYTDRVVLLLWACSYKAHQSADIVWCSSEA